MAIEPRCSSLVIRWSCARLRLSRSSAFPEHVRILVDHRLHDGQLTDEIDEAVELARVDLDGRLTRPPSSPIAASACAGVVPGLGLEGAAAGTSRSAGPLSVRRSSATIRIAHRSCEIVAGTPASRLSTSRIMLVSRSTDARISSISAAPIRCSPTRARSRRFSTRCASASTLASPSAPAAALIVWNGRKTSLSVFRSSGADLQGEDVRLNRAEMIEGLGKENPWRVRGRPEEQPDRDRP